MHTLCLVWASMRHEGRQSKGPIPFCAQVAHGTADHGSSIQVRGLSRAATSSARCGMDRTETRSLCELLRTGRMIAATIPRVFRQKKGKESDLFSVTSSSLGTSWKYVLLDLAEQVFVANV